MKERHLILLGACLHALFAFCGLHINALNSQSDWPDNLAGLIVLILSWKYLIIFYNLKDKQDTELKIHYPNHELSVNEAIEKHKEIERRKRENSKWYEFWKWN